MHHAYLDHYADGDSPVHRLDPRAKLVAALAFTVAVVSAGRYAAGGLLPFVIFPFGMIVFGGVPGRFVLGRLAWGAPFVLMMALLNPLYDATPVAVRFGGGEFVLRRGWISGAGILLKYILAGAAVMAVVSTTKFGDLLKGLRSLGLPRPFILQLAFVYRYIFVLADEAMRMRRAARGRGYPGRAVRGRLRMWGGVTASLLLRTIERGQRIHLAMAARGFDGEVRVLAPSAFGWRDAVFTAGALGFVILVRFSLAGIA
ncbi:MAG: cobalt ECF transporter T component CbiQ [Planctomycetota bacterium]